MINFGLTKIQIKKLYLGFTYENAVTNEIKSSNLLNSQADLDPAFKPGLDPLTSIIIKHLINKHIKNLFNISFDFHIRFSK